MTLQCIRNSPQIQYSECFSVCSSRFTHRKSIFSLSRVRSRSCISHLENKRHTLNLPCSQLYLDLLRLPTLFNFEQVAATRLRLCPVKNRDPVQWSVVVIVKVSKFFSGFLLSTQANFSSVRDSWMRGILSEWFG